MGTTTHQSAQAMPFVSSSIYHKARRLALKEGLSPDQFIPHHDHPQIVDSAKYIPIELLFDVYEWADAHLEAGFAVRQGRQLESDDYGTLGLSWKTCWRARDVLDRLERYMVLVTDHGTTRVVEDAGFIQVHLRRPPHRRGLEMANETSFVMLNSIMQEVTGVDITPRLVCFQHTSNDPGPFQEYFQCPVEFGTSENRLEFRTADIDIPTIKADHSIQQFLVERMEEEKEGIQTTADRLLSDVHQLIEENLPSGIPSILQVAEYLGMSARTFKRRLAEKDLTFRGVVQSIQQNISINLLLHSDHSMGEIAFQTGFSEQSAFNRAFKRWTGQSPVAYRKSH
jgi:AraC-like DNA-binding protein